MIDAGVSGKKIEKALNEIGESGSSLSAILVTHEHSDHICGLGVISRKYHIPIYATQRTIDAIKACDELIKKVSLFDIFESEKLGADKKSMAFKIQLASAEGDVTDEMTDKVFEKVLVSLSEKFDAQMRA